MGLSRDGNDALGPGAHRAASIESADNLLTGHVDFTLLSVRILGRLKLDEGVLV